MFRSELRRATLLILGTGKTLLTAFVALMLLNDERVGGPTVVIVFDRLDLIEQVESVQDRWDSATPGDMGFTWGGASLKAGHPWAS